MMSPQDRDEILALMAHGERQALQAIDVDEVREMVEIEERAADIKEARIRAKRRSREAKTMGYKKLSEKEREAAKSRADLAFVLKEKRMAEAREEQKEEEIREGPKVNPAEFWERQMDHKAANERLKATQPCPASEAC